MGGKALCNKSIQASLIAYATSVLQSYLPVLVFAGLGMLVGGAFTLLNGVLGPRRPSPVKSEPYECGLPSEVTRTFRFGVSFYMVAMLFILFDIEVVFLYPVGVILQRRRQRLRPRRDPALRRAADRRAGLRLARGERSIGNRARRKLRVLGPLEQPQTPEELRVAARCARATCCAATSRARTSTSTSSRRVLDDHAREGAELGPRQRDASPRPSASPAARSR